MFARFFRNATFNVLIDVFNRLSNAVVIILISKFLTIENFGSFNLATSFFTLGSLLSFWGFGNLLIREVAKKPENFNRYFVNFGIMRIILSFVSSLLVVFVASFFNYSQETFSVIAIICLGISGEAIKNLCYSAFNSFEKTHIISPIYLFSSILKIIISYFLLMNGNGIFALAILITIINISVAFLFIYYVKRYLSIILVQVDWKFIKEQTLIAFPLFLVGVFSLAENRLDLIILSGYFPENIVGYYSAAIFLETALLIFPEGIKNAIFPVFSKQINHNPKNNEKIYSLVFKYVLLISLAVSFGSIIKAPSILSVIYKKDFIESVNTFRLLMISFPFLSISLINLRFLNASNKDSQVAKIYGLTMIFSLIMNLILIPKFDGVGAAAVRLVSTFILMILSFVFISKLISNLNLSMEILKGLLATGAMIIVLYATNRLNLFLAILLGALTYFISLIFLRTFNSEEIRIVKSLINRNGIKSNSLRS